MIAQSYKPPCPAAIQFQMIRLALQFASSAVAFESCARIASRRPALNHFVLAIASGRVVLEGSAPDVADHSPLIRF